ncbi:caspase family protein [Roseospira goensis]|uniref:Caspase family p20 domain-containing protein n=1 Tax=Roseospira goensis TaxID=391922 RepID=A0A7W6RZ80_9PROT|nr:caspase family protein [Roseospira goensis]MBB4285938.1 hypothetical protein [Roseospira goensis]
MMVQWGCGRSGRAARGAAAPGVMVRVVLVAVLASVLTGAALWGAAGPAGAAPPPGENRVALVIGNGGYPTGALRNPARDARAVARALEAVGFTVTTLTDATRRDMRRAAIAFGRRLSDGGVGLFYYAGHGVQVAGENYLIPVDAVIEDQAHVEVEGIAIRDVLARMGGAHNRLNIVILDACRDNPFKSVMRSGGGRGLARTSAPTGTYLAYATAPDQIALDGEDTRNSPFTGALLAALDRPGADLDDVFLSVRRDVMAETDGRQVPWVSNSITGQFYFRPPAPPPAPAGTRSIELLQPAPVPPPTTPPTLAPGGEAELAFWQSILDLDRADLYTEYLRRWPDGTYAPIARAKIEVLQAGPVRLARPDPDSAFRPLPAESPPPADSPAEETPPTDPTPVAGRPASGVAPAAPVSVPADARPLGADGSDDPDARDAFGRTALMIAARDDDRDRLRRLLAAGAAVNLRGPDGNTALTLAAWEGHVASARLLFEGGADPLAEGPAGPAWEGLARTPDGAPLLADMAAWVPELGETLLEPDRGTWREAQARLNAQGHGAGPVDGQPGPRTRKALEAFQRAQDLAVTGYLDAATLARLEAVQPTLPRPARVAAEGGVPTLVLCRRVGAVVGDGDAADHRNPFRVTLPSPMAVVRVQVEAHDNIGFLSEAELQLYIDNVFVGSHDVKSEGSTLTYGLQATGSRLDLFSVGGGALADGDDTYITAIRVYALRPEGTAPAACR